MNLVSSIIKEPIVNTFNDVKKNGFISPEMQQRIRNAYEEKGEHDLKERMDVDLTKYKKALKKRAKYFNGKKVAEVERSRLLSDRVKIYDTQHKTTLPGVLVSNPEASSDPDVQNAYKWSVVTNDFFSVVFKRNSLDNNGMTIVCSVNYPEFNAYWNGTELIIGETTDNVLFGSFSDDVDVTAHEFGHGVTQYHGYLPYDSQSGALNEHFSDVYGCMTKQFFYNYDVNEEKGWLIGDLLLKPWGNGEYDTRGALRTMTEKKGYENHPYLGTDPQPKYMSGYVVTSADHGGVHTNSGIPNHAFYLANIKFGQYDSQKYGHSYAENGVGHIWYQAEAKLKELGYRKPTFAQAAGATVLIAGSMYGTESKEVSLIRTAWLEVGVTPATLSTSGGTRCNFL